MKRSTIERLYVGTLAALAAVAPTIPYGPLSRAVATVYLALLGPLAVPGGFVQWVAGATVWQAVPEGRLQVAAVTATFVVVTVLLALVNVGVLRLVTLAVRAARARARGVRSASA